MSSFLPFCLPKYMLWQCIVNRKKFIRCLYNNSTPLKIGCFQKQSSIFSLGSFRRRVSSRVQRYCFLCLMPWIRSLDKTLLVLNTCQSKTGQNDGHCTIYLLQTHCTYISSFHFIIIIMYLYHYYYIPIFLSASLILLLCLVSCFSNFCTL